MTIIGSFQKSNDEITGTIATLTMNHRVRFVPVTSAKSPNAPIFRIFAEKTELGAAWKKISAANGNIYFLCKIDDPSLPLPLFASLVENETSPGAYSLIWSRRRAD